MSHGDHVSEIAPGFEVLGTSPGAPYAITADLGRPVLRRPSSTSRCITQPNGKDASIIVEISSVLAGFKATWTMRAYREVRRSAPSANRWVMPR